MSYHKQWSSDQGPPPKFTILANAVIEHLSDRYYLSAYWFSAHYRGPCVTIDLSARHPDFFDFPGTSLGRIDCGPGPTELVLSPFGSANKVGLDASDPDSFDKIDDYFADILSHRTMIKRD